MASYTDKIPTFNPYVQQLPVEAMLQVGMYKQQKYDEGIQKIQTNIDNVAGLDIYKDSDKAYLQSKLNQLNSDSRMFVMADFSNSQMVNSVNGMTSSLVKDNRIQNAVSATASAKKELAFMEEERKKGTLNPSNEYIFKKKFSAWSNNEEVGQGFNAKYDPYFDVFKFAKETFDAIGDESMSFDQIYQTGGDGKPLLDKNNRPVLSHYMKRMVKEGKFPERVRDTLNQIFSDPRVGKQLSIDGQYNLSGMDDAQLKQKIQLKKDGDLSKYEDQLFELRMKKSMGENVSSEIDTVQDKLTKINSSYDELLSSSDLDGIRGSLYKQDTYDRYTSMFGKLKVKEEILDSPAFKIEFDLNKEAQRRAEKARDQALENLKLQRDEYWKQKDDKWKEKNYNLDVYKAQTAAKPKGPGKDNITDGGGGGGTSRPEDTGRQFVAMADEKYTNAANAWSGAQDKFIYETMFNTPANQAIINQIKLDAPGDTPLSQGVAVSIFLRNQAKRQKMDISAFRSTYSVKAKTAMDAKEKKDGVPPATRDLYTKIQQTHKVFKEENANRIQRDEAAQKTIAAIGLDEDFANIKPETITYRGQQITVSKQNQIDIATYIAGKTNLVKKHWSDPTLVEAANQAKRRLDIAGMGELAERYLQKERMGSWNPITRTVGTFSEMGSGLKDLISDGSSNAFEAKTEVKYMNLANAIADKSYGKVIDNQAKIIKGQYNVNPNKGFTLSTGNAEDDRFLQNQLTTFVSAFTRGGDNQNLATKEEFEAFDASLNNKDARYTIISETDEMGHPVWAVESRIDGNVGRMVLNPDQSIKLGYNPNDIYEADSVMYVRNKLNQNGGKTSIGDPNDVYTYKNNSDYHYDNYAGDFPNVTNPNYTVRANVLENDGKYYPYIYVSDGISEKIKPLPPEDNLSKLDATIKSINDADIKTALK
jgi:hypothetical protein